VLVWIRRKNWTKILREGAWGFRCIYQGKKVKVFLNIKKRMMVGNVFAGGKGKSGGENRDPAG
jgi:hypothetical protein